MNKDRGVLCNILIFKLFHVCRAGRKAIGRRNPVGLRYFWEEVPATISTYSSHRRQSPNKLFYKQQVRMIRILRRGGSFQKGQLCPSVFSEIACNFPLHGRAPLIKRDALHHHSKRHQLAGGFRLAPVLRFFLLIVFPCIPISFEPYQRARSSRPKA